MVIRELGARNFRNYRELFVRFSAGVNILVGANGQGKTNLAEGIYFITALDSFRTHALGQLMLSGELVADLQGIVLEGDNSKKVRIEIARSGRRVWVDEAPVQRLSSYISSLFALIFNPDSLYLYRNFPAERRLLFNRFLAFLEPAYLKILQEFKAVHTQKNRLLKTRDFSSLPAWNQLFTERNAAIVKKRQEAAEEVNALLPEMFAELTGRVERLRLDYRPSLRGEPAEALLQVQQAQEQEAERGHAVLGAHRDDFRMVMQGPTQTGDSQAHPGEAGAGTPPARGAAAQEIAPGAALSAGRREPLFSQGEYRVALLSLLLALSRRIEHRKGFRPVLILDDVYSELDAGVQRRLSSYLQGLANQIFITATQSVEPITVPGARIMEIRGGRVETVS